MEEVDQICHQTGKSRSQILQEAIQYGSVKVTHYVN
ncbi:ribbon-helix-helix domain-containing protein [Nostoc sp. XA013]|nr:ribbon-helix-helix domain-containing protein [Nostoc sp. XA013]